jgi:predicted transposase YdaD
MLAESTNRWTREIREEGRQEGEAQVVLRLLRLKFGRLEPETVYRVRSADPDRLLKWGERVLTAQSLQDVFPPHEEPATLTLEEIETMLAENIDRWNRELLEKGRQQGRQEGEARVVLRQLRLKFGPLEPAIEDRVRSADTDRLLEWGERVLTAQSLQDVFRD